MCQQSAGEGKCVGAALRFIKLPCTRTILPGVLGAQHRRVRWGEDAIICKPMSGCKVKVYPPGD